MGLIVFGVLGWLCEEYHVLRFIVDSCDVPPDVLERALDRRLDLWHRAAVSGGVRRSWREGMRVWSVAGSVDRHLLRRWARKIIYHARWETGRFDQLNRAVASIPKPWRRAARRVPKTGDGTP